MPRLGTKDVRSTRRAAEDVVGYNAPRDEQNLVVEEQINSDLEWLTILAELEPRNRL